MFNYKWKLSEAKFSKDKGKVFSCFSCGGGSTMGYKLAGFDVIGCNEIDPKMMEVYKANHNPKYSFLESIVEFSKREEYPEELYDLDILDGSPPCSSFSIAGNREDDWGKEKKFREGQSEQVLDTLFFDFIHLADKLKPKAIVAENVKGLLMGEAKAYVNKILIEFDKIGYYVDYKLLDGSKMGVPQKRERVFFYAIRKDLYVGPYEDLFQSRPVLDLEFNCDPITFGEIYEKNAIGLRNKVMDCDSKRWIHRKYGDSDIGVIAERVENKRARFNVNFAYNNKVLGTLAAHKDNTSFILYDEMRYLSRREWIQGGSFPEDYNFLDNNEGYLIGMSVPPVMMAHIANRINEQWLEVLK